MYDVITVGSATRDAFIRSSALEIHEDSGSPTGLDSCFPLGAKIDIDSLTFETGGGATNAAVTFRRFGHLSAVVSAIGADDNGRAITQSLRSEGVATGFIQTSRSLQTAFSAILLSGTGERTILVHRGAAEGITAGMVPWERLRTRWFYLSSLGGKLAVIRKTLRHAARIGAKVAWNPGNKELQHGLKALRPLIARTDVFILNLEEAMALIGTKDRDPRAILESLRRLPRRAVIVTDGSHGAYAAEAGRIWHSDVLKVKQVNMTGAGDAFGSGLVAGLMKKDDLAFALAVGTCNAGGVVQKMGAKVGILHDYPSTAALRRVRVDLWK